MKVKSNYPLLTSFFMSIKGLILVSCLSFSSFWKQCGENQSQSWSYLLYWTGKVFMFAPRCILQWRSGTHSQGFHNIPSLLLVVWTTYDGNDCFCACWQFMAIAYEDSTELLPYYYCCLLILRDYITLCPYYIIYNTMINFLLHMLVGLHKELDRLGRSHASFDVLMYLIYVTIIWP